jgi:hypothetical protein
MDRLVKEWLAFSHYGNWALGMGMGMGMGMFDPLWVL